MTDGELVRLVVAGDTAVYEVLARRWYYRILAYCQARLISGHFHDAEDLTQDVFVRGFRDLNSLADSERFGSWLRGIANHLCSDWGRDHQRNRQNNDDVAMNTNSQFGVPVDVAIACDERTIVLQQIAAIPEDLREVILLHYFEELTYDEMARWLGVARATVNERLAKARSLLRIRLAKLQSDV